MGRIVRQTAEGPHLTRDTDQVRAKLRVSRGITVRPALRTISRPSESKRHRRGELLGGDVRGQGDPESPGSDGASPYLIR